VNLLGYDATLRALESQGVPREKALKYAREQWPEVAAEQDAAAVKRSEIREKEEQAAVIKLFREHGFTVRSTSQARRSKIAIGFPDLFVTHRTMPLAFFFETKRQVGGVVSDAQRDFGDDCRRCGIKWFAGDRDEAQRIIADSGAGALA
jgi:hypothetical protein